MRWLSPRLPPPSATRRRSPSARCSHPPRRGYILHPPPEKRLSVAASPTFPFRALRGARWRDDLGPGPNTTPRPVRREFRDRLTVIVPAYNEAETLADTLRSLRAQTLPAAEIVVVDDCSTDDTAEIAESFGVTVVRPPVNTGSKAGAQTFALDRVRTDLVMAVDADTTLAPDAIELLLAAFDDPEVAAACGLVLPPVSYTHL